MLALLNSFLSRFELLQNFFTKKIGKVRTLPNMTIHSSKMIYGFSSFFLKKGNGKSAAFCDYKKENLLSIRKAALAISAALTPSNVRVQSFGL